MYYIGNFSFDPNYIEHHGIKGQKWGVRRFQNADGSLTAEGEARYGGKTNYRTPGTKRYDITDNKAHRRNNDINKNYFGSGGNAVRGVVTSTELISSTAGDRRAKRLDTKAKAMRDAGNIKKAEKLERKAEGQRASNANLQAYMDHTSNGKIIAQDLLLGRIGGHRYRKARSRGAGRVNALIQSMTFVPRLISNKRAYGSALQWSAMDE